MKKFKITHIGDDYALIECDFGDVLNKEINLDLAIMLYIEGNINIDRKKIDKNEWLKFINNR